MIPRRTFVTGAAATALMAAGHRGVASQVPSFTFPSIAGGTLNTADWRGHPVLVVNTASLCGYTSQLAGLQALHEAFGPRGLVVLAVPSNSFAQEYSSAERVKEFCTIQYGITLPMTDIVPVRGAQAHPFYRWMQQTHGFVPKWNFNKVLLDGTGRPVKTWGARTKPQSNAIRAAVKPLLPKS